MRKKWADCLVDPLTKEPLELVPSRCDECGDRVIEGELRAPGADRAYPILRGIPRFVDPVHFDETLAAGTDAVRTGRAFSDKWRSDAARSLGTTDWDLANFEERLLAVLNLETRSELDDLFRDGMRCLDGGCGIAWPEWAFNVNPRVERFAVDLSLSVEVAHERTREASNVLVAQASLLSMPFPKESFDLVMSDGVIHHTGDAKAAFGALCDHLKPGGFIGIYVYCVKPFLRELADRKIRTVTTEMSHEECAAFGRQMALLGKALQACTEPLVVEVDVPLLGIEAGIYDLQKFIYDHFVKCYHNGPRGLEKSVMCNVDWYHPKHATHHTREEVLGWFEDKGIRDASLRQPAGWEHSGFFVSGRKQG